MKTSLQMLALLGLLTQSAQAQASLPTNALGGAQAAPSPAAPTARALTLTFGETKSGAELLLPASPRPAPLVLLIQGTGPEDRDGRYVAGGQIVPGSLGALAQSLARQGFAVMRFDKRYAAATFAPATAPAAFQNYAKLTLKDLLSDARTALNVAKAQPGVDGSRVFVYGWSEGSVIAAALAPEAGARGLIVQGPVVDSFAATFAEQFATVGLKYLQPYAKGGEIDLAGVLAAFSGSGSPLAKMQASLLFSLDSTPQQPKLSTVLDTDRNGKIDLEREALPTMRALYPQVLSQSPLYTGAGTLPTLATLAPQLKLPVLILQGENDGNIAASFARQLDAALTKAGSRAHTLKLYPGLGHSLGRAPNITQDTFAPMEAAPMNDMAAWMRAVLGR
ncbi:hypothetical protein SAMN04488058_101239 [Deinococcus reticulitermitis]|uniref:Serine aminopeptidase S33 domain-containing protein n=1 Tax=Deinococcus reticulitermitis TaxID=856736 RepID=A0A1H6SE28_9DEIO|nr:alpha/beta hydrolase [Deinococcus reticulitermitis]SEI65076.1 hypothetical protein SAMN04488058_101239 [Deinococcus reticulitermitis]